MSSLKASIDAVEGILNIFWQTHINCKILKQADQLCLFLLKLSIKLHSLLYGNQKNYIKTSGVSHQVTSSAWASLKKSLMSLMAETFYDDFKNSCMWGKTMLMNNESARSRNFMDMNYVYTRETKQGISTAAFSHLRLHFFRKHSWNDK